MSKKKTIDLEPGCLVYLRSGSARMSVLAVRDVADEQGVLMRTVDVVWSIFETHEIRKDTFPDFVLDVVCAAPERELKKIEPVASPPWAKDQK